MRRRARRQHLGGRSVCVRPYRRTTWSEQSFIKAPNARPYNSFGVRLALSGDGNSLAGSSYLEDNAGRGIRPPNLTQFLIQEIFNGWREHKNEAEESGALYLFTRAAGSGPRALTSRVTTPTRATEFGSAVAISGDGHTFVARRASGGWAEQRGGRLRRGRTVFAYLAIFASCLAVPPPARSRISAPPSSVMRVNLVGVIAPP
jgi:hypothetical protein